MNRVGRSARLTRTFPAVAAAVLLASCGSDGPKLYPVSGKVLFLDKPAEGAQVVFHLVGGDTNAPKPAGTAGPDGTFTLSTFPHGDGAPAGEYQVVVTWYGDNAREEGARNKLPARYADAQQSGLKATVKPEATQLEPFKLTK
jgi:hypothetical protein